MPEVAVGLKWPNRMALLGDSRTLLLADSHQQPIASDVQADTTLTRPRMARS